MGADQPADQHEWVSFEDPEEERTWVFDVTFLTSRWSCIFGRGCPGIAEEAAPELVKGCCDHGAHFTDDDDRARVQALADRLTDDQWQFRKVAAKRGGPIRVTGAGEIVTRRTDGACIFLNRVGFGAGPGCALHQAADAAGERFIDWKPEVCWQAPLRRHDETDDYDYVTSTIREWKRRDWGPGGADFGYWCTEDTEPANAFTNDRLVYQSCRDELIEMTSPWAYETLATHLDERLWARPPRGEVFLPHPAVRR